MTDSSSLHHCSPQRLGRQSKSMASANEDDVKTQVVSAKYCATEASLPRPRRVHGGLVLGILFGIACSSGGDNRVPPSPQPSGSAGTGGTSGGVATGGS